MKTIRMLLMLAVMATVFLACQNETQGPQAGRATISGIVTDASSAAPLAGITIEARVSASVRQTQTTGTQGSYEFTFDIDSATIVTLSCRNNQGFRDTVDITATIRPNAPPTTLDIQLTPRSLVTGGGSGVAQTIAFLGANPQDVSVYGVGGQETSTLGWEVRDSLGIPIDAAHAVPLTFTILGGLNGGEYVSPVTVTTNALGRAFTTFNSGIRAGAIQVVATTQVVGHTIASQPVRIVIHSGFAVQSRFTVGAARFNFPALGIVGMRDAIGVLVGDIYGNPVATNTAVYMTTRAGVIISSIFTSNSGEGSADLISGNPYPTFGNALTQYGNGYHYVIASTLGQSGAVVKDSILILWTGASVISNFSPSTINVPNAGFQQIGFQVSDGFGNPLSAPSTISVSITGVQADVAFGTNGQFTIARDVILPVGVNTHFSCLISDARPDTGFVSPATLTVSVTSAGNGNATASIGGTIF